MCFLTNVVVLCTYLLGSSYAFITTPHSTTQQQCRYSAYQVSSSTTLHATITKRQSFILDGAELSYYIQSLVSSEEEDEERLRLPNLAPRSPKKCNRVGSVTFVTATLDNDVIIDTTNGGEEEVWLAKGTQIIGVQVAASNSSGSTALEKKKKKKTSNNVITIDDDLQLYKDSIAILKESTKKHAVVSDVDAISTAATSLLLGASISSCNNSSNNNSNNTSEKKKAVVIVGGGEYALFLSKAFIGLGYKVHLVSARPSWSLPSSNDIVPSLSSSFSKQQEHQSSSNNNNNREDAMIDILPPSVGKLSLGFMTAIGEFDILIDTLGDELGIGRAMSITEAVSESRFLQQLQELHGCNTYLSTLTRSQQYVLKNGLLFARDAVIRYQKEVEKLTSLKIQTLPPPRNFGTTLQQLFDQGIIYKSDQNENGKHAHKSNFVRGWSLSDLTELKTWPMEGAVRCGFPVVDLSLPLSLRQRRSNTNIREIKSETTKRAKSIAQVEESIEHDAFNGEREEDAAAVVDEESSTPESTANATTIAVTKQKVSSNPYISTISSASDLNRQIIEPKRNCIMFLTASYCQKCKRMTPQLNRIARISSEESTSCTTTSVNNNVLFAHVDISKGPRGKQLGKILNVNKVPSVIIFENGECIKAKNDQGQVDRESSSPSIVIDKSNLSRLEEVAKVLNSGERNVNLRTLLVSSPE